MDERVERTLDTYERVADRYAQLHDDRAVVADIVTAFLAAVDGNRVLDVGCGPGWETATFEDAGLDVVALDLSPSFLADAHARATETAFIRADMRSLPVATDAVDGIWACASLLHVPRSAVGETLAEFRRVLTDGGLVGASMQRPTDGDDTASPYEADDRHFEQYEPAELRALFADAGFEVVDCDPGDQWVYVAARA